MRSAYGRIASIRACARRSRAEATSSNAFVILRVLRTDRIRRRRSWTEAMGLCRRLVLDVEGVRELLQLRVQLPGQLVGELLLVADLGEDRALRLQVLAELLVEARHLRDGHAVEIAVDA